MRLPRLPRPSVMDRPSPRHPTRRPAPRACGAHRLQGARRGGPRPSRASLDGLYDFLRGVIEIVGRYDVEAGILDDLLAEVDIGAFEPHHERYLQANFVDGGDDTFGD